MRAVKINIWIGNLGQMHWDKSGTGTVVGQKGEVNYHGRNFPLGQKKLKEMCCNKSIIDEKMM